MSFLHRKITIEYHWQEPDGQGADPQDVDALESHAEAHIAAQRLDGYVEGELLLELGDTLYRGYWSAQVQH